MKIFILTVNFLISATSVHAILSPMERGLPDIYMNEEMLDGAKKYRESLHSIPGGENEIFSVKCSHQMLADIINILYDQGFRILSISCNEPVKPIWVINFSK